MSRSKLLTDIAGCSYKADPDAGICIALPLQSGSSNPRAWHVEDPLFAPVVSGDFTGSVREGAPVNFFHVRFNPHGNGTHSESVGHISADPWPVHKAIGSGYSLARLLSLHPRQEGSDSYISREQLEGISLENCTALIIRTLPNLPSKKTRDYSGQNPVFIHPDGMQVIADAGIRHLLIDTPSVDKENDGGKLTAHKIFWNYPENPRKDASITEMVFIEDSCPDGLYLLQIQIPCFELDAAPSRPFIFPLSPA